MSVLWELGNAALRPTLYFLCHPAGLSHSDWNINHTTDLEFVKSGTVCQKLMRRNTLFVNFADSHLIFHKITVVTLYLNRNLWKDWQIVAVNTFFRVKLKKSGILQRISFWKQFISSPIHFSFAVWDGLRGLCCSGKRRWFPTNNLLDDGIRDIL